MKWRQCQNKDCGVLFTHCPQVPGQRYCARKECRRAGKRAWTKRKLASDPNYQQPENGLTERKIEKVISIQVKFLTRYRYLLRPV